MQACDTVLKAQQSRVAIPRRFAMPMRELLMLQPRFNRRSGVKSLSLLQHPRFRAAYDFLLLRAQVGVADPELAKWWTEIQCCRRRSAWRWCRRARPIRRRRGRLRRRAAAPAPPARRSGAHLDVALWRPAYVAIGSNLDQPRERVLEAFERLGACPRCGSNCARACTSRSRWGRRINRISSMPPRE
jgi:hypothetical protein